MITVKCFISSFICCFISIAFLLLCCSTYFICLFVVVTFSYLVLVQPAKIVLHIFFLTHLLQIMDTSNYISYQSQSYTFVTKILILYLSIRTYYILSYDVTVIPRITSYHKNRMTTRVITFWCVDITSLTTSVLTMRVLHEILLILTAIKSNFKGSYDKKNLTLVVILYEIYETRRRLVS